MTPLKKQSPSTIMLYFQDAAKVFDEFYQNTLVFPASPYNLYEPCRYTLEGYGKRIRPVLCLMAYQLFEEHFHENVFHAALSFEMFHNFTLIHDDIMDNASVRRGKPSVYKKFGTTAAILSGDVMNICAYDRLAKVTNDIQLVKLLRLFNKTAIEICEGQQLDMDFELTDDVSMDSYIDMIKLKTSVLLAACLKAGGILANASEENLQKLYGFGIDLGIAFQIQDDYLDTFGTEEVIGKKPGGDIRANKKTALSIALKSKMAAADFEKEMNSIAKMDDHAKYTATKQLYENHAVAAQVKAQIAHYTNNSFALLESLAVDTARKEPLRQITQYLLNRNK